MLALYQALLERIKSSSNAELIALRTKNQEMQTELEALKKGAFLKVGTSTEHLINGPGWPITFNADGLVSVHNCDFMHEPLFQRAYALGINTGHKFGDDLHVEWRAFVCCWAAYHAKQLGGDYVECGVNTGILSRTIMEYIDFKNMPDRTFYLLDTYEGIPDEQITKGEREQGVDVHNIFYFDCYDMVCKTFQPFARAKVIRGQVPDTLKEIISERIGYVSIDMNCVAPEIAAGDFLWPRLISGAIVVLDDYGWKTQIHQKNAWDAFATEKGVKILALPTGQGLLIKP